MTKEQINTIWTCLIIFWITVALSLLISMSAAWYYKTPIDEVEGIPIYRVPPIGEAGP